MENRILSARHLAAFREHLIREEKSTATIEKYLRDAGAFLQYLLGQAVTKERTVAYKGHLQERGFAISSINSMLAGVNGLLDFLGWGECKVKNLRFQRQTYCPEEKELTREEYIRLLRAAEKQEQLQLLIQTICATGIRVSELRYFTVEAMERGEVTVRCKAKTRRILVPGELKKLLLAYAAKHRITAGPVFVTKGGRHLDRSNIWARMKRLCRSAGVDPAKVYPHNLRKLFARCFYGIEKDIAKLADILGHSSINTTRIYIMTSGTEHRRKIEQLDLVMPKMNTT